MDELNKGMRVLVVDDDRLIREILSDALREDGCEVRDAASAREALRELAEAPPFDIVVSDLSMQEMDGLQLLEVIKRERPKLDVIILTGFASLDTALQAMRLGAADYLRKPVKPMEIVHAARQVRLRRRILDENEALRGCLQTFEASRVLASCLEVADILPLAIDLGLRLTDRTRAVGRVTVGLQRPGDGTATIGFDVETAARLRSAIDGGSIFDPNALSAAAEGDDAGAQRRSATLGHLAELDIEESHVLELPLRIGSERVGALWILGDGQPFTVDERQRTQVLVAQTELALANAQRFHQASEKAFMDDVTELHNARYLMAALDREVSRAERVDSSLSVLFLDLDRFKRVNDVHGHLVGSNVLRQLGHHLSQCTRSIDTLARYGGDEFTIVLVDTDHDEARDVAERIRQLVERVEFGDGLGLRLTVSVGVATFPAHGRSRDSLLEASDQAMYLGKARGRNHVCSADELD